MSAGRRSRRAADRGLLLRRYRYGESSLVVHVLTRGHGRVHLLAKGAYRPTSGYYGALDLFDTLELEWRPSTRSELSPVAAARPVTVRRAVTRDLERYRCALTTLELWDKASVGGQAEPRAFDELERTLDRLAGGIDPELVLLAGDLTFLDVLGLAPALEGCASCGGDAAPAQDGSVAFSVPAGGRLCEPCAAAGRASGRVPAGVLRIAVALATADTDALARIRLPAARRAGVRDQVDRFLEYHLDARPRTRAWASRGPRGDRLAPAGRAERR